jgi:type IV secretion system protein VirB10
MDSKDTGISSEAKPQPGAAPKPDYKILVFALGAMVIVVGGLFYLKKRKADRILGARSADERLVGLQGQKIKKAADDSVAKTQQSQFGTGLNFDAQGNLQGAKVGPADLPANKTMGAMEAQAQQQGLGKGDGSADAVEAQVDRHALTAANMRPQGPRGGPSSYGRQEPSDPETMRAKREDQQVNRELMERPMLAYHAGIGVMPLKPGSSNAGQKGNASNSVDPNLEKMNSMLDKATAAMGPQAQGPQGTQGPAKLYGGAAERRAVASRPGQMADMRTGRGPDFRVDEGKFLDAVVVNQVEASWNDTPLVAMVVRDLLSPDGEFVLVPRGSKVLVVAERVRVMDQERVLVKAHRVIFPDKSSAWFPERTTPEGMNPDGSLGVVGNVNRHFWRQFGAAIVLGVVEGYAAYRSGPSTITPLGGLELTAGQSATQAISKNLGEVSRRIMDKYSNVGPSIAIKSGTRMKFYFSEDTLLSGYMPASQLSFVRAGGQ